MWIGLFSVLSSRALPRCGSDGKANEKSSEPFARWPSLTIKPCARWVFETVPRSSSLSDFVASADCRDDCCCCATRDLNGAPAAIPHVPLINLFQHLPRTAGRTIHSSFQRFSSPDGRLEGFRASLQVEQHQRREATDPREQSQLSLAARTPGSSVPYPTKESTS